jgi:hypothetical protein
LRARGLVLAAAVALAVLLIARPLVHGVSPQAVAAFWVVVLGEVVVPGVLLCRGARLCRRDDPWLTLGQGTTLGLSIQGLALLGGRGLGHAWLPTVVAVGVAALGLILDRRRNGDRSGRRHTSAEDPAASSALLLTLVVALGAVAIQPLNSAARVGEPAPFDLLYHAGTAGELRHRWPLQNPRVAGAPLRYHLLAYALPVEAADLGGAPVADPLLALAPLFWLTLLALQTANAARTLFGEGPAGGLAAAVVLFHADPGRVLGLGPFAFNSLLATGVYGSPTTVCGLIVLAGLVIAVDGWIEEGGTRRLLAVGLLGAAASAVKATVLPVVVGGLVLCAAWALCARRTRSAWRWVLACAAAALAGAPLSLWQSEGYSGTVHWLPGAAFTSSRFATRVADTLGPWAVRGAGAVPAFLAWLIGYFGLAGLGAGTWLARRREALRPVQGWALAMIAVGGVLGLTLERPGFSQLFLLYDAQLLLCLFAGAGLRRAFAAPRTPRALALAATLAVAALPAVDHLARALPAVFRADRAALAWAPSAALRDYAAGLGWLRANAATDAVVFADDRSLYLSAFGEVRLFYENWLYTPRAWEVGPGVDPWPERTAVQERLLRRPDPAAVAAARQAVGPGPRLLVVADYVPSRVDSGIVVASPGPAVSRGLFPDSLFARRFANGAMQVYEVRAPGGPSPAGLRRHRDQ